MAPSSQAAARPLEPGKQKVRARCLRLAPLHRSFEIAVGTHFSELHKPVRMLALSRQHFRTLHVRR